MFHAKLWNTYFKICISLLNLNTTFYNLQLHTTDMAGETEPCVTWLTILVSSCCRWNDNWATWYTKYNSRGDTQHSSRPQCAAGYWTLTAACRHDRLIDHHAAHDHHDAHVCSQRQLGTKSASYTACPPLLSSHGCTEVQGEESPRISSSER